MVAASGQHEFLTIPHALRTLQPATETFINGIWQPGRISQEGFQP
jgi:hypothetical protein